MRQPPAAILHGLVRKHVLVGFSMRCSARKQVPPMPPMRQLPAAAATATAATGAAAAAAATTAKDH
eukprot:1143350-Pelagomonas_calceolata.AAC.1